MNQDSQYILKKSTSQESANIFLARSNFVLIRKKQFTSTLFIQFIEAKIVKKATLLFVVKIGPPSVR
jgi:hypothetical protein